MSQVWIDGRFHDKLDAKLSVFDHGLLFGDGLNLGLRIYNGRPFEIKRCLARLFQNASQSALPVPLSPKELQEAVEATILENRRVEGFVRILITRGAGPLTLDPRKCIPSVVVIAEDAMPYPKEIYTCGLDVVLVPVETSAGLSLRQSEALRARVAALRAGCLDAILFRSDGIVFGGTDSGVYLVRGSQVIGPTSELNPEPELSEWVRRLSPHYIERSIRTDDLDGADEVFLAGQTGEIIGVRSIDRRTVGSGEEGPKTRSLRERFREAVHQPYNAEY